MHRVATIYAKSLLQLATSPEVLSQLYTDMQSIAQACTDHPTLHAALKRPTIQHTTKATLLQTLFQDKVHPLTHKFLGLIAHKQRAALLPAIAQAFVVQYNQQQGIQIAQVTTSVPLSDTLTQQLQALVQQIAPCTQVALTQQIDPTLIGGYILQVGDKQVDQSLRKQLKTLRKQCVIEGY